MLISISSIKWVVAIVNTCFIVYSFDVLHQYAILLLGIGFLSVVCQFLIVAEECGASSLLLGPGDSPSSSGSAAIGVAAASVLYYI